MRVTRPRATKLSQILVNVDLDMGAHNITLDPGQTVDGKDVSENDIVVGVYVGDGEVSQEIDTGLTVLEGLIIHRPATGLNAILKTLNHDPIYSTLLDDGSVSSGFFASGFIDGCFYVDDNGTDAAPNRNGEDYCYIAWGQG